MDREDIEIWRNNAPDRGWIAFGRKVEIRKDCLPQELDPFVLMRLQMLGDLGIHGNGTNRGHVGLGWVALKYPSVGWKSLMGRDSCWWWWGGGCSGVFFLLSERIEYLYDAYLTERDASMANDIVCRFARDALVTRHKEISTERHSMRRLSWEWILNYQKSREIHGTLPFRSW
jgi:hypothetical protein